MAAPEGNQYAVGHGRPTEYKPEYDEQAFKLCLLGHTDADLAKYFNVTETTINNWKSSYISFFDSIKRGKEDADMNVAKSLYDQALGYHYHEETEAMGENGPMTFHNKRFATKDFRATRFWLMNRQPDKWREKTEVKTENDHNHKGVTMIFQQSPGCEPLKDRPSDEPAD